MSARDRRQEQRVHKPRNPADAAQRFLRSWIRARRALINEKRHGAPMDVEPNLHSGDVEVILREGYPGPIVNKQYQHVEL